MAQDLLDYHIKESNTGQFCVHKESTVRTAKQKKVPFGTSSLWPPSCLQAKGLTHGRSTDHQKMSNKVLIVRCEVTWSRATLEALIRQNKSARVKQCPVCNFCMTCNLDTVKPIPPSVLMRCAAEDLFYGCNFTLMFPLVTLSCCILLHRANKGLLLLTDSTCF